MCVTHSSCVIICSPLCICDKSICTLRIHTQDHSVLFWTWVPMCPANMFATHIINSRNTWKLETTTGEYDSCSPKISWIFLKLKNFVSKIEKSWMQQGLSNSGIEGKRVFARGVGGKALNWSNKVAARSAGRWNNASVLRTCCCFSHVCNKVKDTCYVNSNVTKTGP